MQTMYYQLIIFDLGETLFNFGRVDVNALFREGAKLTYDFLANIAGSKDPLPSFWRYHWTHWLSVRVHYILSAITLREFNFMDLMAEKAQSMGIILTAQQKGDLTSLWFEQVNKYAKIEPDLHSTLEELRKMPLKLAIISNTFLPRFIHDRQLEQFGLIDSFDLRLYSSETIWRKPNRKIYEIALEELGIPAERTIMVGDRLKEDVIGPGRIGIRGIFKRGEVNRARKIPPEVPMIEHIADLPALIRHWSDELTPATA